MRAARIFMRILIGLFAVSVIFGIWYKNEYAMGIAKAYSVNTPEAEHDLLIVTQGSEYKDAMVAKVVGHFSSRDIFIQVYDVSRLPFLNTTEWDAVVILHTWEIGRPPKEIRRLLYDDVSTANIIFHTTSGSGEGRIEGVDGMSGASILSNTDVKSRTVISMVNELLAP